jgi:hypothetical protein
MPQIGFFLFMVDHTDYYRQADGFLDPYLSDKRR